MSKQADLDRSAMAFVNAGRSADFELLGRLVAPVLHDLSNLLAATSAMVHVASEDATPGSTCAADLDETRSAIDAALALTIQLKHVAKASNNPCVVDVGESARRMSPLVRALLGRSIQLETRIAARALKTVIDPVQLERIVINLATNARDAMPDGGRFAIVVEERMVEGRANVSAGRYAVVEASDTGVGVPASILARLFEPYFTTKRDGLGIGLATCAAVVEAAGGAISVDSKGAGMGATFTVWLPVVEERA